MKRTTHAKQNPKSYKLHHKILLSPRVKEELIPVLGGETAKFLQIFCIVPVSVTLEEKEAKSWADLNKELKGMITHISVGKYNLIFRVKITDSESVKSLITSVFISMVSTMLV